MLVSICLEIVLILMEDRCLVCAERTIGLEIVLDATDGTRRWCGSSGILFWSIQRWCLCRSKIGARFAPNIPYAQKSFWMHLMVLIGDEARFGPHGDSDNLDAR
jgi:hypothetical protein